MAVVLRLSRAGAKKAPFYHIVAADSRKPRDGAFLEQGGTWDPRTEKAVLNTVVLEKWTKLGAKPSETVAEVLRKAKKAAAASVPAVAAPKA